MRQGLSMADSVLVAGRRSPALVPVLLLLAVGGARAQSGSISTPPVPDDRAGVTLSGAREGDGGFLRFEGQLGAHGFDNEMGGSAEGDFHFTNPPFYAEHGSEGGKYEETFGPRVANATIGVGGITEGIDAAGRTTVLGWPGPGMYDHVSFVTVTRNYPNQGAAANAGSFGGVVYSVIENGMPLVRGSWLT
ncbi:MAG: hypothetical protein ACREQY_04910, partial [Candidatus Binatia bacterium]